MKDKLVENQVKKQSPASDGADIEKASGGKWIEFDRSPKPTSDKKDDAPPASESKGPGSGGSMWKSIGSSSPPATSPKSSGQSSSFGFGFFSKEEAKVGDKTVISTAFKK